MSNSDESFVKILEALNIKFNLIEFLGLSTNYLRGKLTKFEHQEIIKELLKQNLIKAQKLPDTLLSTENLIEQNVEIIKGILDSIDIDINTEARNYFNEFVTLYKKYFTLILENGDKTDEVFEDQLQSLVNNLQKYCL